MRGKVSEKNVKAHLETQLDLTRSTMENMGITQAYRLGKNPEKETDPCPPVIIFFNKTDMVEAVIKAARGEGRSRNFKEHIPELYSKVYNEFIRVGVYLKENQGLNYRLRFKEHALQLQVKKPEADQNQILKICKPTHLQK